MSRNFVPSQAADLNFYYSWVVTGDGEHEDINLIKIAEMGSRCLPGINQGGKAPALEPFINGGGVDIDGGRYTDGIGEMEKEKKGVIRSRAFSFV